MGDEDERLARVAKGWDEAAEGYDAYFVPRFAPWVSTAVAAITTAPVPDGPVLVPCCGSFPELDELVGHFPDREIVGIDLSAGMVRLASARAAAWPKVLVRQGDAANLDAEWAGRCAAVVSVFGLQQLPDPELAVRSWAGALRPGGRLSIVYWPGVVEEDGPFARVSKLLRAHVPAPDSTWEHRLAPALAAAGATLERDELPSYPMSHPDAPTFIDAYTDSGPMRGLAIARGEAFVERLRAEYLHEAPAGELRHRPRARLLVASR